MFKYTYSTIRAVIKQVTYEKGLDYSKNTLHFTSQNYYSFTEAKVYEITFKVSELTINELRVYSSITEHKLSITLDLFVFANRNLRRK